LHRGAHGPYVSGVRSLPVGQSAPYFVGSEPTGGTADFCAGRREEQGYWDRLLAGCQTFNQTLSSVLSTLHDDIYPAGQVRRARLMLIIWSFLFFVTLTWPLAHALFERS
jgi:hypothetical protein